MSSLIFKMKKSVTLPKSSLSIKDVNSVILLGISNNFVCLWCSTPLQPISDVCCSFGEVLRELRDLSSVSPILPPQLQEPAVIIYKNSLKECVWGGRWGVGRFMSLGTTLNQWGQMPQPPFLWNNTSRSYSGPFAEALGESRHGYQEQQTQ